MSFMETQLKSNFASMGRSYRVASAKGEIKKGLQKLITEGTIDSPQLRQFAAEVPPLELDVFLVILNNLGEFVILVCEIKNITSVGLRELSQLIGYCLIANSKFGLLINVDGGISNRFVDILVNEPYITHIVRIEAQQAELKIDKALIQEHLLGVMKWNSKTKRLEYTNAGKIITIPQLCKEISNYLE